MGTKVIILLIIYYRGNINLGMIFNGKYLFLEPKISEPILTDIEIQYITNG